MASSHSDSNMSHKKRDEGAEGKRVEEKENEEDEEDAMLDEAEAEEEIPLDEDHPMDGADENDFSVEIQLQNDSIAHFDGHKDSIFCIAAHPLDTSLIATGSGDDTAHIFSTASATTDSPLLPPSYESNPQQPVARDSLPSLAHLTGHSDSVNAMTFSRPRGDYLFTAGLDGQLRAYRSAAPPPSSSYVFHASVREVEEINWLASCPSPAHPDTVALGASDNSVWVYSVDADPAIGLALLQVYYLHQGPCTAGAWSPDGSLLATVAEDSSFHVFDPFGTTAATTSTSTSSSTSQAIISLTSSDQRFHIEGGLYSVAISPSGTFAAVGGSDGTIHIIGLPMPSVPTAAATTSASSGSLKANKSSKSSKTGRATAGGAAAAAAAAATATTSQAGQILATLRAQTDSIESLAFAAPPLALLAAGSVDGSVALFDTAHRFAVRRHIRDAHDGEAVVKVDFVPAVLGGGGAGAGAGAGSLGHVLTTCGMDGVVRRWDTRGGTAAGAMGLMGEWRGHRSAMDMADGGADDDGDGGGGGGSGSAGGVLGFVQDGRRIVTAGDDGVALVFDTAM